ncbi:MAG: DUF4199 domain-containing protein [Candidatus Kapabacteria bacterium]|nr:DUF4199 domain-containing protein [Candidatus Kapabacteria bacterium]
MLPIVLRYGIISAIILLVTGLLGQMIIGSETNYDAMMVIGFTSMFLAFIMVYLGIRAARKKNADGKIGFRSALVVGMLISLFATAMWVVTWEVTFATTMPDFMEKYTAKSLADLKASGATAEDMNVATIKAAQDVEAFKQPLFRIAMATVEILPIGLIVALIGAAVESRRSRRTP